MSFEWKGLLLFTVCAVLPGIPFLLLLIRAGRTKKFNAGPLAASFLFAVLIYADVCIDAFLIEPNWPQLEKIRITGRVKQPLTILQLSDLHLEALPQPRDAWLMQQLGQIKPDIIVLTGDIHQLDMFSPEPVKKVLGTLNARLGVFACTGMDNQRVITEAVPGIRFLENDAVLLKDGIQTIALCGLLPISGRAEAFAKMAGADYKIVMNHTPDLAQEAVKQQADLYLCGHTHGGQVRIPFWGAIITNTGSGKQYEAGLYQAGQTYIYTSRGLGLEPPPAVQVRFLCRPQITLFEVSPNT